MSQIPKCLSSRLGGALLGAIVLSVAGASPSLAMQEIGTIEATIGGQSGTWTTLHLASEDTATAEHSQVGPMTSISIQGHDPESGSMMRNVLSLDVTLMGEGPSAETFDSTLSLFPEGMSGPFFTSGDGQMEVSFQFDDLDLSERGHARGRFSGQLCRQDGMFAEPDLDDCRAIEGTFDTQLHLAEY
ncbi:hypothetical protein GRZ55_13505 [Chelativorans sp. ZYF759]|uniref:hypothetical protein n=1 Tax=Chelativorans sp. ZYF759 TaxID=2692213 RepID=UPI00145C49F8|nr:hypothetical protein [Chelativorans sp. ZYF759]NMG40260.1 hypothetical protein [Chelativorans sp. ZYF759]